MGGCQNYGPFLGPSCNTAPNFDSHTWKTPGSRFPGICELWGHYWRRPRLGGTKGVWGILGSTGSLKLHAPLGPTSLEDSMKIPGCCFDC